MGRGQEKGTYAGCQIKLVKKMGDGERKRQRAKTATGKKNTTKK